MLGSPSFRPHIVEFIRGTGVRVDGVVVQDVGGDGPFTWVVPDDVSALLDYAMVAGGEGGQGGGDIASPLSLAGGSGGGSGRTRSGSMLAVLPSSTLTITIGAAGTAGAVNGSGGGSGGDTSIAGILPGPSYNVATTLKVLNRNNFRSAAGSSASAVATNGGGMGAPGQGTDNTLIGSVALGNSLDEGGLTSSMGGGGAASGAVGSSGGLSGPGFGGQAGMDFGCTRAVGTNGSGISRGGGGSGGSNPFGRGGNGGSNAVGEDGQGYGTGGGGGAGGFAGGAGVNGYVRFTYWSAR